MADSIIGTTKSEELESMALSLTDWFHQEQPLTLTHFHPHFATNPPLLY